MSLSASFQTRSDSCLLCLGFRLRSHWQVFSITHPALHKADQTLLFPRTVSSLRSSLLLSIHLYRRSIHIYTYLYLTIFLPMTSTSANLSQTVAYAISFLTRPLVDSLSPSTFTKLQMILEANLIPYYAPSWDVKEPLRGSGRRCLTLSPSATPPRPSTPPVSPSTFSGTNG